jgi:hypothetical protein
LKFADNSSKAALGTDSSGLSNTWDVNNLSHTGGRDYTSEGSTSGSFYDSAGGAASKMFDDDASSGAFSSSGTATFTFGGSTITASSSLKVRAFKGDASGANVLVNGTNISSLLNAQSSGGYSTVDITSTLGGAPINLSNVSVVNASGGSGNIAQIFVDDVALVDGGPWDNDSLIDTPTNYSVDSGNPGGNYCVMNSLLHVRLATLSNGNLDVTGGSYTDNGYGTIAVPSGKWYAEATVTGGGGASNIMLGVKDVGQTGSTDFGAVSRGYGYRNDAKRINSDQIDATYGTTYTNGDTIGIALDLDAGTLTFYKNGSSQGQAYSGISSSYSYHFCSFTRTTADKLSWNFGQRPFKHTVPSNHLAVCTTNLDDPLIADGSTAFDVDTWSGDDSDPRSRTLSFGPDLVWIKTRNQTNWNYLTDSVRSAPNKLYTNSNSAEDTAPVYGQIDSLNSDGFTLGGGTHATDDLSDSNKSGTNYVAWAWNAGTGSAASNSSGTVTSSVKANQTAGFSIVTATLPNYYTNYTIGHGLNATPHFIFGKNRASANQWDVYHKDVGTGKLLRLNQTAAVDNATANQDSYYPTAPTSSVFGFVGNNNTMNFVWYVFTEIEGYSKFGTYTGNGNADGPVVFTGMRPRWVLLKNTSSGGEGYDWLVYDTERDTHNVGYRFLCPNSNNTELRREGDTSDKTDRYIDILSNGFKIRNSNANYNASGSTFVYAAFAEHPFSLNGGLAR